MNILVRVCLGFCEVQMMLIRLLSCRRCVNCCERLSSLRTLAVDCACVNIHHNNVYLLLWQKNGGGKCVSFKNDSVSFRKEVISMHVDLGKNTLSDITTCSVCRILYKCHRFNTPFHHSLTFSFLVNKT